MIDLRRLHTLRVLEQQGTVTAAAELLHLTPSAVSHQIAQLGRDLKLQLLERHGRRVHLTPAARALVAHADDVAARWEQARAKIYAHPEASGVVRVAGFPSVIAGLLTPMVRRLRQTHPQLRPVLVEAETQPGHDMLLAGEADLAVYATSTSAPVAGASRFQQQPLLEEPLDLLVPSFHRLAQQGEVRVEDLEGEEWIVPLAGTCDFYELTLATCTMAGFAPNIAHRAMDNFAVTAMVGQGLGIAMIPRLAAALPRGDAVRLPIVSQPRPTRQVHLSIRDGSDSQPAIRAAVEALRAVAEAFSAEVVLPAGAAAAAGTA
ncbi:MAG: LysR family transcriptional regulator [Micromonosporaceae bacterium]